MKNILTTIILLFAVICSAALSEKEKMALSELDKEKLKKDIKDIYKEMEETKKSGKYSKLNFYRPVLKTYTEHPFVEADTGYKKKWFASLKKLLDGIVEIESEQRVARNTLDKKKYKLLIAQRVKYIDAFIKLIKNPAKVDKKELVDLRKTARRKRREIQKKLDEEEEAAEKAAK